jgi:hypothetical protein
MPPTTSSRLPSVSRRMRVPSRAAWLGARAANVRQRPRRFVVLWTAVFGVIAAAFIGIPRLIPLVSGGRWVASDQWPTHPVLLGVAAAILASFVSALVALADEMRDPCVADAAEAERVTALRVLTTTRLAAAPTHPARRAADRSTPPWLVPGADEIRILSWHLTSMWPRDGVVTVAADDPMVAGVVGANLAAAFAVDARATLLVDTDFHGEPVRHLLGLAKSPGLVAVMENRRRWTESLIPYTVGRGRTMFVLPAGHRARDPGPAEGHATGGEIARAARRHDATVVVSPTPQAISWRAGDDVVLCVVRGVTRLSSLSRTVVKLIDVGARVRGIVLWEGPIPARLPNARPVT